MKSKIYIDGKSIHYYATLYNIKVSELERRLNHSGPIVLDRLRKRDMFKNQTYQQLALQYNTTVQIIRNRVRLYKDNALRGLTVRNKKS